jgi:hypothetical protein
MPKSVIITAEEPFVPVLNPVLKDGITVLACTSTRLGRRKIVSVAVRRDNYCACLMLCREAEEESSNEDRWL